MTDKRSQNRFKAHVKVEARLEFSPDPTVPVGTLIACQTQDMSLAGFCLQVDQPLPAGSRLLLAVDVIPPDLIFNHLAEVVWCRESDNVYLMGLTTTQHLCDELEWRNAVLKVLAG